MHSSARRLRLALAALLGLSFSSLGAQEPDLKGALDRAMNYLVASQNEDGGYGPFGPASRVENASDVGITAFVVYAMACHPRGYQAVDGPFLSRAVEYLLSRQQKDGAFYDPRDPVLLNYRASVAILALSKLDRVRHAEAISRAKEFVLSEQRDERQRYSADEHLPFGSVGQSGAIRGDLSNAAFAAEALHEAGLSISEPFWKRLSTFVSRCQNHPTVDPLLTRAGIGTTGDYGFRYAPNDTRGPKESLDDGSTAYSSYGSMTYQGLKSLLYAQVDRSDPRVRQAFAWISKHFTVVENPGMATARDPRAGLQGLFYYYHAMAKTLAVYGEPVLIDGEGRRRDWAKELSEHLISLQKPDGHWANSTGRWWEDLPTLDTAYSMIALSICAEQMEKNARAAPVAPPAEGNREPSTEDQPADRAEGAKQ